MNFNLALEIFLFFLLLFYMIHNEFLIESINTNTKISVNYEHFQKNFIQLVYKYKNLIINNDNITEDCPIWVMYYKGIHNSPSIIKASIASIEMNSGKHPIYKLDKFNYDRYILLPKYLLEKFNKKIFNLSHFLEILRMGLLSKFGGFWIDLTYFNTYPSISFFSSLFHFKLSKCNENIIKILMPNNFFVSSKKSFLTTYSYNAFLTYWKHHKFNNNYLLDYIIYVGYQNVNEFKNYINKVPYINCNVFLLNKLRNEDYQKKMINNNSTITNNRYINDEYNNKTTYIPKLSNKDKKNDFCIIGLWYGENYGSMATYYALHKTIVKMGYSVMMIENPLKPSNKSRLENSHQYNIAKIFYHLSSEKKLYELYKLNEECKGYIVGSDQLWNIGISRKYESFHFLGFADNNTKKISYATSFGIPYEGTEEEKKLSSAYLRRFDGISVRDKLSFDICQNIFGIKDVVQVCDPSFLCDISDYEILINMAKIEERNPYILAYILDPTQTIGLRLEQLSNDKNMKVIVILDEKQKQLEINKKKLGLSGNGYIEIKESINLYEWMWYFNHSKSIFTDSFHGTIFSIIFKKPFIALENKKRGAQRFISLLKPISLMYRLFNSSECIIERNDLLDNCDFSIPYKKLDKIRKYSKLWLENILKKK